MSTAADYVGRTVDVLAYQGRYPGREEQLVPALAAPGNAGKLCAGIQKLAQRWILEFLTERGSLGYLPDRGCDFMLLLRQGELRTTLDAEQAFYLSAQQVQSNLRAEEDIGMPEDEQLDRAELLSLAVAADQLTLSVQVHSRAGTSRAALLPIAVRIN